MDHPNRRLLSILGLGWLAFAGLGWGLRQGLTPTVTVIIDRSYCAPAQWQTLATEYTTLHEQYTQKRLNIDQVIYVSDLGQVVAEEIPTPDEVRTLNTFGLFNETQMNQALQTYPEAEVLSCGLQPP